INIIERAFGGLKTRWRFIFLRVLEVRPTFAPKVITACCILYSICIAGDQLDMEDETVDPEEDGKGTGTRHRSRPWPTSSANNTCRLVIPPESKDKKFVFFIGDSHLRAIVDGFAPIKEESLYFGFLAVPGGAALDLRTEILNAVIPRIPDLVCLLAPSNTLKRSTVVSEAGKQFKKLLTTVCILSPKVFVLDFPPRLNVDPQVQSLLRQEFHRVSVQLGVSYKSVAELFPMRKLHLWSRDGVHLSDDDGMKILNKAIYEQIHKPPTETEVMPTMSCSSPKFLEQVPKPTAEKVSKLVCAPEVPVVAPQNPFEWNIVGSHKKFSVELNPKLFDGEILEILGDGNTSTFGDASIAPFKKTKVILMGNGVLLICAMC
uniref:DDE Tnp4 domain-containing protein n=1 Tax=Fundulus heteroclitus TaxID=8078 RepID=A0A3Q2PU66_FUNHE